jgi:quercetin dioxygenase-like cupin family protein
MSTAQATELVPALEGSPLALTEARVTPGAGQAFADADRDLLLYVFEGSGSLTLDDQSNSLAAGSAGLVLAGEGAVVEAGDSGIALVCASVGLEADRHAPLGAREHVVPPDDSGAEKATGARSFRILFGPHNGSTRATLFAGFIPPGKAPWHYHLYDEIVWVPEGPGRLHVGERTDELGPGSAFRLRPRQVHIVENLSADAEMTVIGVFTPAGTPSAAYLTPDVAADYGFAR